MKPYSHHRTKRRRQGISPDRSSRHARQTSNHPSFQVTLQVSIDRGWIPLSNEDQRANIEKEFRAYLDQWRRETLHTSSLTKMVLHPSYMRIIGMGREVLPLLLKELSARPDHWMVALNAITGSDPAPPNCTFDEAVAAWLAWGREHRYLT